MLHDPPATRTGGLTRQELALIGITVLWGATYLVIHVAVQHSGPWFFVGLRFLCAAAISALVFARSLRGIRRRELCAGAAIGVMICGGYGLQTVGLQSISSSTSAFITALFVPLVPLLQWVVLRHRPSGMAFFGVALAFGGLLLLADPGSVSFGLGPGEIVTVVSTVFISLEIILISLFAGRVDVRRVLVVQLLTAGLLSMAVMPVTGESPPPFSWVWLSAALALGAATCLIQLAMNWAQRCVTPTRATLIYAGEPVWAGVIGRLAGERLPAVALLGAALIVAGAVVSELTPRQAARSRDSSASFASRPPM